MYDFRDLQPRAEPSSSLPLEAICYAGKWLDREIPEFETLVVEGRGGFERQINAPERVGDGSLYLNSRIKERKITVTFRLLCNTIERYNEVLAKLNQLTYAANVEVKFADEQGYHYIGTIESISLDKPLFSTTGKIEIVCADPYKYSLPKTIEITGTSTSILDPELTYQQIPKLIEFTPNSTISKFEMRTNASKVFTFNETIGAGTKLTIDFTKLAVKLNTTQHLMGLKLSSNFSDFYIQNGTTITLNAIGKFNSHGMEITAVGESIGGIGWQGMKNMPPNYQGLLFWLDGGGDYMAWAARNNGNYNMNPLIKLSWYRKEWTPPNSNAGFNFDDTVTFNDIVYPSGKPSDGMALRFFTTKYNGHSYPTIGSASMKSGIMFGDWDLFLIFNDKVIPLQGWKIPVSLDQGRVSYYKEIEY